MVKEEIRREVRRHIKLNENGSTLDRNSGGAAKAVLRNSQCSEPMWENTDLKSGSLASILRKQKNKGKINPQMSRRKKIMSESVKGK